MVYPVRPDGTSSKTFFFKSSNNSHGIHLWYIYLHLFDVYGFHVDKHTSPIDPLRTTGTGFLR